MDLTHLLIYENDDCVIESYIDSLCSEEMAYIMESTGSISEDEALGTKFRNDIQRAKSAKNDFEAKKAVKDAQATLKEIGDNVDEKDPKSVKKSNKALKVVLGTLAALGVVAASAFGIKKHRANEETRWNKESYQRAVEWLQRNGEDVSKVHISPSANDARGMNKRKPGEAPTRTYYIDRGEKYAERGTGTRFVELNMKARKDDKGRFSFTRNKSMDGINKFEPDKFEPEYGGNMRRKSLSDHE